MDQQLKKSASIDILILRKKSLLEHVEYVDEE